MEYHDTIQFGYYEGFGKYQSLYLTSAERMQHCYIVGQTGTGKSTLLKNLLIQDIHAGRGCGLIDMHGDLARELLDFIPQRRIEDTVSLKFDCEDRMSPTLRQFASWMHDAANAQHTEPVGQLLKEWISLGAPKPDRPPRDFRSEQTTLGLIQAVYHPAAAEPDAP